MFNLLILLYLIDFIIIPITFNFYHYTLIEAIILNHNVYLIPFLTKY